MKEEIVVFKDKKSRAIETFVHVKGHGARMSLNEFIELLAESYGSPATTMRRASHLGGLKAAAAEVIHHMKAQTVQVATKNLENKKD